MESLQTTLTLEQIQRFRFNSLMDFKKPARSPTETVAVWEPVLTEADRIRDERQAVVAAWPSLRIVFATEDKAARAEADVKMRADAKARIAAEQSAFTQMMHCHKLRDSYSYELAHSLWYAREAAHKAIGDRVRAEYEATWRAEFAAQEVFENEQADAAIATLKEANPHLPEATLKRIRTLLKYRLHLFFRRSSRSAAPRHVLRGAPKVLCGSLPSKAHLEYPAEYRGVHIDRAF
jgi:hypothetical protein